MTYVLEANFTSDQPCDACTTSSGASGSSWPCAFRLALCGLDVSTSAMVAIRMTRTKTHLKNVYDRTTSSRFRHAGSSSTSLSMKNSRGMSTSSPANSFCSSKQKHSTLAKYGAIYDTKTTRPSLPLPSIHEV